MSKLDILAEGRDQGILLARRLVEAAQKEGRDPLEAKENYLRRYQWDLQELEQMEQELAQLRLKALPGGISYDGMPHGSGDNKADLANYAATLDDFLAETEERRQFLLTEIRAIKRAIEAVPVQRSRILLRHIYINGMSWSEAAEAMNYSEGYVKRALRSEALTNFQIL